MQALSQSVFLQALGYAIANSLWQVALLWMLAVALNNLLCFSSNTKYKVVLAAQVLGFLWFIATLNFYYQTCGAELLSVSDKTINTNLQIISDPLAQTFNGKLFSVFIYAEQLLPYLSIAYLILLVFLSAKWINCYRLTRHIKKNGLQKPGVQWKLFVKNLSAQLSIKPEVNIYLSQLVSSPLTIGFLKPIILIPLASVNHLSTEQMEAVILHELAHIKRADYLINIIQSVIELALFFNPFTKLLSNEIKKERENSCDDWVLQFQYNASQYAEALLRIAYLHTSPGFAMSAAGVKGDLLSRVKRMLNQKEKNYNYRNQLLAFVLITGIISCMAWLHPRTVMLSTQKPFDKTKQFVVEPLAAKVTNPLFSPIFFLAKERQIEKDKILTEADSQEAKNGITFNTNDIINTDAPVVADRISGFQEAIINAEDAVREADKLINPDAIAVSLHDVYAKAISEIDARQINNDLAKAAIELNKVARENKEIVTNVGNFNSKLQKSLVGLANIKSNTLTLPQPPAFPPIYNRHPSANDNKPPGLLKNDFKQLQQLYELNEQLADSINNLIYPLSTQENIVSEAADLIARYQYAPLEISPVLYNDFDLLAEDKDNKPVTIVLKASPKNAGSYQKNITIETIDGNGKKHIYHIMVEAYQ